MSYFVRYIGIHEGLEGGGVGRVGSEEREELAHQERARVGIGGENIRHVIRTQVSRVPEIRLDSRIVQPGNQARDDLVAVPGIGDRVAREGPAREGTADSVKLPTPIVKSSIDSRA